VRQLPDLAGEPAETHPVVRGHPTLRRNRRPCGIAVADIQRHRFDRQVAGFEHLLGLLDSHVMDVLER
jgi:hypothetical protein